MENDLEPQIAEQKCRVFPLQNGDIKKCFGFSQTKLLFLCSLDLKDAYFSVHVNESSQAKLKFFLFFFSFFFGGGGGGGQLYMLTAFPNGLACCPRLFSKLLKPVMAHLHMLGFVSTIFIDDTADGRLGKGECAKCKKLVGII